MALIWCDGFDHYGGSMACMLDGAWAEFSSYARLSSSTKRTGSWSLDLNWDLANPYARRVLGGPKAVVGVGFALWLTRLPSATRYLFSFRDASNAVNVHVLVQSTGVLEVRRGDSAVLGASASPVVVAGSFQHIETRVKFHDTEGQVEVRVNGVPVINVYNVDTVAAQPECSQVSFQGCGLGYIDDLYAWDDTGDTCNDFLGDLRVLTLYPDADTLVADWTPTGQPTGAQCIDEASPNDDTDYIACTYGGDPVVSEFDLQDAPNTVGAIRAVQVVTRAKKIEAGSAGMTMDLVSGAAATAATEQQLTDKYTYRQEVFPLDPATGTPWTRSSLSSAKLRLTRTS